MCWAVSVADAKERKVLTAARPCGFSLVGSWRKDRLSRRMPAESRLEMNGKPLTGSENAFAFRVSWASPTDFYYVSDGKIRKRSMNGGDAQTIDFKATMVVTPTALHAQARLGFHRAAQGAWHRAAGDFAGW